MMGQLSNKVALITGGGTGIGRGIALAFAREGAAVAVTGRRKEPLLELVESIKHSRDGSAVRALAIAGDVSKPADAARMVEETVKAFGGLHLLVNNAGIAKFGNMDLTADEDIDAMVGINLKGPMFLAKAAIPHLKKHKDSGGAAILNISSSVTSLALKNFAVYSATKAGLDHLTRCMALDYGGERIRVNAICPGVVDTPIFDTMMPKAAVKKAMHSFAEAHPLGRVGTPEDIAAMAVFLCGPQASWITGAVVPVDGGIGLGNNA
ncbi:MAG: SDR family oxidoreductase [Planctomycetes bacterium]|nr:SDR family oxidoreductase [Planctomycetota bacterium]